MPRRGENIRKRNDGRWEGRYRHRETDGTYKYKSVYGKTYREVKERMNIMLSQTFLPHDILLQKEQLPITESIESDILFNDAAEKWLTQIEKTRKYSTYIKYLKLYEGHIKDALQEVRISDISNDLIAEKIFEAECQRELTENMRHSIIALINQTLKYATEYFRCPTIKLSNKHPKDRSNHIEIINHSDQALLLKYLYQNLDVSKAGIILCMSTGLRLGEICSLKWEDIDLEQMVLHVNSTVQRIALLDQNTKTTLMTTPKKRIFRAGNSHI